MKDIVVYGAGGLAREVEWLIRRINSVEPTWRFGGYIVTDRSQLGEYDSSDKILGDEAWLFAQSDLHIAIGIGTPRHRVSIGARLRERFSDDRFPVLIDPTAVYDDSSCSFGPGVVITAGNILTVNIVLEAFAFINLDCSIGHEAVIGPGCVLNPSVNISGGVRLGSGVLVGTGAQVLQYVSVGNGAMVGAGAVVTKDVGPGTTMVGVPAKPLTPRP